MAPMAEADFGIETFTSRTTDADDVPYTLAGGHPDKSITVFSVGIDPGENLNGTYITLPPGFIANPAAAPRCSISKLPFDSNAADTCPPGSQVGVALVKRREGGPMPWRIYNVPPERGYPAQFAFRVENTPSVISVFPRPRTESYGLTIGTPNIPSVGVTAARIELFGVPSQYGSGITDAPFLSNPVDCSAGQPTWSIAIDSAQHTGALRELGVPDLTDPDWKTASDTAPPVTGVTTRSWSSSSIPRSRPNRCSCRAASRSRPISHRACTSRSIFRRQTTQPTLSARSTRNRRRPRHPRTSRSECRPGLAVSPATADGLGACSDQDSDPAGDQVRYDNTKPVDCPNASKIGTAVATSPLLGTRDPITDEVNGAEPIPGEVFFAEAPPGGSASRRKHGWQVPPPDRAREPALRGQHQAAGHRNRRQGDRPDHDCDHRKSAVARQPPHGRSEGWSTGAPDDPGHLRRISVSSTMVPWSTPGTPDAHPTASFTVGSGPGGSGCPAGAAARPFAPSISAGHRLRFGGSFEPVQLTHRSRRRRRRSSELSISPSPRDYRRSSPGSRPALIRLSSSLLPAAVAPSRRTRSAPPLGSARSRSVPAPGAIPSSPPAGPTSPALTRARR